MIGQNVTPARAQALAKLARHSVVRVGAGMWDDDRAAVSPAGAHWLIGQGYAEWAAFPPKSIIRTELGDKAARALELDRG